MALRVLCSRPARVFSADGWERGCARGWGLCGAGLEESEGVAVYLQALPMCARPLPRAGSALPTTPVPGGAPWDAGSSSPPGSPFRPSGPMLEVSCWDHSVNARDPPLFCFMVPFAAAGACSLQAVADILTFPLNAVLEAVGFWWGGGGAGSVQWWKCSALTPQTTLCGRTERVAAAAACVSG